MNRLIGNLMISLGLFGFLFFQYYKGDAIPFPAIWSWPCLVIVIVGAYFIARYRLLQRNTIPHARQHEIEQLKKTGEQIMVTLDNAEVKSRSFQQEVNLDTPSKAAIFDAIAGSAASYRQEQIQQTYIVYHKVYNGMPYKFISPGTTLDPVMVKKYLHENGGIRLYVDTQKPSSYYFEFPFQPALT